MTSSPQKKRQPRTLAKDRWTPEQRSIVAIASEGSFDPREKRKELRESTQRNLSQVLGFFLGYLDRLHPHMVSLPLAQSLTQEALEGFRNDLATTNTPRSVLTLMDRLKMLCARAELPEVAKVIATIAGSSPGRAYVPPPRASARQVYRAAKAYFLLRVREIRRLGFGRREKARERRAASEALTALTIMFLTQLPLRIKNVLALDLGVQIIIHDDTIVLLLPGEQMKSRRDFDAILGKELSDCVRLYLRIVRPILAKAASPNALLLGAKGGRLAYPTAYSRIRRMTQQLVGERINPHAFRRLMAVWARNDERLGLDVAWRQNQHVGPKETDRTYAPPRVEVGKSVYQAAWKRAPDPT
ncbi:tyrosine-type recombinase/integrase [Bosea sp. RAC05]|jgi:integrase|uniref:tyrosine-type recombinase/integrase n=1 Tax=Bosea sp. RAC05 TaxID=1842539 RepID=UPI00083D8C1A|nr:tyrosine-type recombinase/integrase [Bosea sp. RAC05]AOG07652.1 hypothetical protein BSY19_177 [Bosea sp. RAC05]